MPAVTINNFSEEMHPWNYYIPDGATKLLIGTFPTEKRNRKHDFFYSSSTNRFWAIMSEVARPLNGMEQEIDEVKKRKLILQKLKLGLTDMGAKILRQQGSSNDHSLFPIEFMDIAEILNDFKSITTIILTGSSMGNSSLSWFGIFCSIKNIPFNAKQFEERKIGDIIINNRPIQVRIAYSPSRLSRIKTNFLIDSYKTSILS